MNPEQYDALISAVRAIAHGPASGPTGLELVSMALAKGGEPSVSASISQLAAAVDRLADAVENTP